MTPATFTATRKLHGSQLIVARALGIGFRTLQRVESGSMGDPIPDKYAHMIKGLAQTTASGADWNTRTLAIYCMEVQHE